MNKIELESLIKTGNIESIEILPGKKIVRVTRSDAVPYVFEGEEALEVCILAKNMMFELTR